MPISQHDFVQHGLMEDLIRERELQLKTKDKELDAITKLLESERKKLDRVISTMTVRKKEFESIMNQLESRRKEAKDLESKRKHFEGQVKEFELKQEKFESQVKELNSDERRGKQNEVSIKSFKEENELGEHEPPDHQILVELEATSDPAKVVLDIIQKPIVPLFKNKGKAFIMDSGHIFLLEQLLRISPHIKPCVRGEAMKLARDLEGNMRTSSKNPLEVLGFLLLLSIYGLVPFFDEEEVLKLFEFADKSSGFIQNLVKKQQHIEAVRFICAFKLADKNQPVDLLWKYMQNAKLVSENTTSLEIQDKARDQEVATLTNVLLSISDNKLESVGLLNEIRDHILELIRRNVSSVCTGTWSILKMCNTLRKRNVDPKCGRRRRMEPSESKSAAEVSNGEVPQQQQQQLRSSEPSPLAKEGALGGELRNKLDFKGAGEGESSEGCAEDCMMYLKTGSCRFGSSCMFNNSIRSRIVYVRQLPLIKKYV